MCLKQLIKTLMHELQYIQGDKMGRSFTKEESVAYDKGIQVAIDLLRRELEE